MSDSKKILQMKKRKSRVETIGVACVHEGFRFIGIEREQSYFDAACRRIEAAVAASHTDMRMAA